MQRTLATALAITLLAAAAPAQMVKKSFAGSQAGAGLGFSVGYIATLTSVPNTRRLLVGEPWFDADGGALVDAGKVSYLHGALLDSGPFATKFGDAAGDLFGWSVAGVGDVNGDGHSDFAIGAPGADVTPGGNEGRVRVYHGLSAALLFTLDGTQAGAQFGFAVGGAGDVNADGSADVAVGEPFFNGGAGRVLLYSGATGLLLGSFTGNAGSHLGWSVAGVGDTNHDGKGDVAAGAPEDATNGAQAGRVVVVRGPDAALLQSSLGPIAGEEFGFSVNGGMDADNDGQIDLVIGAPGAQGGKGTVRVRRGPSFAATWLSSTAAAPERFGAAVDFAGDVDKDGFDDIVVGSPQPAGGPGETGKVTVLSGKTKLPLYTAQVGTGDGDEYGFSVVGAGDVDLDGWDDVLVGAPFADDGGADAGGAQLLGWQYSQPDLGGGGVGSAELAVYGAPLATGATATMTLKNAAASAPAWLIASLVQTPLPFKGGVLMPNVGFALILVFATDATGALPPLTVPGGGGPLSIYAQFVVKDPAQTQGWQLTHCIRMDFLP